MSTKPKSLDTETLVCKDIKNRQQVGIKKYGTTLANSPLSLRAWLLHSYEECLDMALYLRRAIQKIDETGVSLSEAKDAYYAEQKKNYSKLFP